MRPVDAGPAALPARSLRGPAARFALLLLLLAGAFAAARWTPLGRYLEIDRLQAVLAHLRGAWWSPFVHLGAFVVLGGIGVPATPIILAGAAIFGAAWGTLWNWTGIVLASVAGFLLAKALGREFVERIGGDKLRRAETILHRRGFLPLVAVRFVPVPFALVNAAAAVVGVRFSKFLVATMIGMVAPIGIFTYFAATLLAAATGDRAAIARQLLVVSASMALLVFLPIGIRRRLRRRRLRQLRAARAARGA
ncbi:MAG: VTT domain-containing protein [Thermoanaerobaculia bacterium]|nr:VTT domain-containing protein [Thermoanaerobaculia bacterium]